jgi:hypothetical protein
MLVEGLHMQPPLTMRPPAMNERWTALGEEMRAVFAFADDP